MPDRHDVQPSAESFARDHLSAARIRFGCRSICIPVRDGLRLSLWPAAHNRGYADDGVARLGGRVKIDYLIAHGTIYRVCRRRDGDVAILQYRIRSKPVEGMAP